MSCRLNFNFFYFLCQKFFIYDTYIYVRHKNHFSFNLYKILKDKQISHERFAFLIGVSPRTVYDYLSGIKFPRVETLLNIANLLKVSLDSLFEEHEIRVEDPFKDLRKKEY